MFLDNGFLFCFTPYHIVKTWVNK